ncbi:OmpA family protein [Vibrio coralliilyticus]|uniref:OmpA family protein n=1 Tax=Vibrio coralliilyticus TaxID=190893 RepID=UPI00391748B6
MKKLAAVVSGTLLLASASANAQFYLGAKAGASWVDDLCTTGECDDNSWALGSFVGYEFNDYLALEAGLDTLGETTGSGYKDAGLVSYSLAPRFSLPLTENIDAFAKAGGAYVEYGNKSDSSFVGSVGLSYSVLPNIDIQVEYQRLTDIDIDTHGISGNAVTLGFTTKFGGSDEQAEAPAQEEMLVEETVEETVVVKPVFQTFESEVVYSVSFKFDSAELTPESEIALKEVASFMGEYPQATVDVVGYTDTSGPAVYNQKLSEQRAQSVADVIAEYGVNQSRIHVEGAGESNPIATNETRDGRIENRRAEVTVNEFEYEVQP